VLIASLPPAARKRAIVAIAILCACAFCAGLLIPAINPAQEAARRTSCRNNLKAVAHALHRYHDDHGRLPSPDVVAEGSTSATSWRIDLPQFVSADHAPSLGHTYDRQLASGYDRALPWDDAANLPIAQRQPQLFWCPANRTPQDDQQRWYSAYAFLTGPGTAFPSDGPLRIIDITDGTSTTLLVVEACGRSIVWTEPRDVDVSRETIEINAPGERPGTSAGILSSYHEFGVDGSAQAAFADGSVRFLSRAISPDVLRKLTTATGGEGISDGEF
jgi:hypothetical protein